MSEHLPQVGRGHDFIVLKILQAIIFAPDSSNIVDIGIPSKGLMKHRKKLHGIMPSALPLNKTTLEYLSNIWESTTLEVMTKVYSIVDSGSGTEVFTLNG
jgi:hypothetical protein